MNIIDILSYKFAANIYLKNKQYEKALQYISQYTKYFTNDFDAVFTEAQINFFAGNYLKTIQLTNFLFEKSGDKIQYYHLRAKAYLNANAYE